VSGLEHDVEQLVAWLDRTGPVAVLSGAGLSTESGIPDYRGPTGAARPATPMTYQVFTGSLQAQQRYWARSHLGWRTIARARPNAGHRSVAALAERWTGVVTQNVDGLHGAAATGAAADVVELHGNLDRVVCLRCGELSSREALDQRLREANPHWSARVLAVRPDGDVELDDAAGFHVVACAVCAGTLKPDVVFFGENVPAERVARCFALVEGSAGLLVLGSSLTVMSGYRFVLRAARLGLALAIVNQGPTRGDDKADLRLDAPLGAVLTGVVRATYGAAHAIP
jgi:NAD-dependent SIR2 family protein deacetylase